MARIMFPTVLLLIGSLCFANESLLDELVQNPKLADDIKAAKVLELRRLPGGEWRAPELYTQVKDVMRHLSQSSLVDPNLKFEVFLASTAEIDVHIHQIYEVEGIKLYHIVVSKGFVDMLLGDPVYSAKLGPEMTRELKSNARHCLAGVLAHEIGHAVNGDMEDERKTTMLYRELAADEFGVRLSHSAGYRHDALVIVLKAFGIIFGDQDLRSLISQYLSAHPKPRFRIAALMELVNTLSDSQDARKELGFAEKEAVKRRGGKLSIGKNKTSKNASSAFKKKTGSPKYQEMEFSKKAFFLEQYLLASRNYQGAGAVKRTVVLIVGEYKKLLSEVTNAQQESLLIESLFRFEKGLGDVADKNHQDPDKNVKGALHSLKKVIVRHQVKRLKRDFGETITHENVARWVQEIDCRYLYGELTKIILQSANVAEVESTLALLRNHSEAFSERFRYPSGYSSHTSKDISYRVYEAAAIRVLALTQDLSVTMDFMQANFPLEKNSDGVSVFPGMHRVWAGLLRYSLSHRGIKLAKALERLESAKTAKDGVYALMLSKYRSETTLEYLRGRGVLPVGSRNDIIAFGLGYGIGHRPQAHLDSLHENVRFALRVLDHSGIDYLLNDMVKRHYTSEEAFEVLRSRYPESNGLWAQIEKLDSYPSRKRQLDLQTHFNRIFDVIGRTSTISTEQKRQLREQIAEVYSDAGEVLSRNVERVLIAFASTPYISVFDDNNERRLQKPAFPHVLARVVRSIDVERRYDILKLMLLADMQRTHEAYGQSFISQEEAIRKTLERAVSEGKISEQIVADYMRVFKEFSRQLEQVMAHPNNMPADKFFLNRRKLGLMTILLREGRVDLRNNAPESLLQPLRAILGLNQDSLSSFEHSKDYITAFLSWDKATTTKYMDRAENVKANIKFTNISRIVELVCRFEGVWELHDSQRLRDSFSNTTVVEHLHWRNKGSVRVGKAGFSMYIDQKALVSEELARKLIPVPESFWEMAYAEDRDLRHSDIMNGMIEHVLKGDLVNYELLRATKTRDPIEALIHTIGYFSRLDQSQLQEVNRKLMYTLFTRALRLVRCKTDMDAFVVTLSLYYQSREVYADQAKELFTKESTQIFNFMNTRYRNAFFNELIEVMEKHESWQDAPRSLRNRWSYFLSWIARNAFARVKHYHGTEPWIFRFWIMQSVVYPYLKSTGWYQNLLAAIEKGSRELLTKVMLDRRLHDRRFETDSFFRKLSENTPYSEALDRVIANYILSGKFASGKVRRDLFETTEKTVHRRTGFGLIGDGDRSDKSERNMAVNLVKSIRSLNLRYDVYKHIMEKYGPPKMQWHKKLVAYVNLAIAYSAAKEIWGEETLERLAQAKSVVEAWRIREEAWRKGASQRASAQNTSREKANYLLTDLKEKHDVIENPFAGEIGRVFREGSRHRNQLIEDFAKSRSTTFAKLNELDKIKSENTESPYHSTVKVLFEVLDEYSARLKPVQLAEFALYLAFLKERVSPEIEGRIQKIAKGTFAREKAIKQQGLQMNLTEVRFLFNETHPEDRLLAFRAMYVGRISEEKSG
jgi:hypothetical protein